MRSNTKFKPPRRSVQRAACGDGGRAARLVAQRLSYATARADRLEKITHEIAEVENLLAETDFTFGNIKVLRERPVTMPWEDPPRLN